MLTGAPLVLDGFNASQYAEGASISTASETPAGFADRWEGSGSVITGPGSLGYAGFGTAGGLQVELVNNALMARRFDPTAGSPLAAYRGSGDDLGAAATGSPLYVSFLWQVGGPSRPAAAVSLYRGGTDSGDRVLRVFTSSTQPNFQVAVGSSAAGAQSLLPLDDDPHLFVVRIDFAAGEDTISVWQNPLAGAAEPAPQAQFSYEIAFDRLALSRFGGTGSVRFDEFRMGSTWSSVTGASSLELLPGAPLTAEGFAEIDYPEGVPLEGLAGWTPGYQGAWATLGTATVAAGSLNYPGYGAAGSNRVVLQGTDVVSRTLLPGNNGPLGNYLDESGRLATSRDGSPLFVSFLLEVGGSDPPAATFSLYDGGITQDRRQLRVFSPGGGLGFQVAVGSETVAAVPLGPYGEDPQLFVIRIDFAAGVDVLSIWHNPDPGLLPGHPDAVIDAFDLAFDRVAVTRFQGQGWVAFDELRMGGRWADVVVAESLTALPDPVDAIIAMAEPPQSPHGRGLYPAGFFPFIDGFGQYIPMTWPEKVTSAADLAERVTIEAADLANHPGPVDFNRFGGWATGPALAATGRFRTEKIGDRWWLVDPEGRLFFSHGITGVSDPDRQGGAAAAVKTGVSGRDHYFADLPLAGDPTAAFLEQETAVVTSGSYRGGYPLAMNFFASNAVQRYGSNWEATSQELAHDRLRSWGMNTIGGFSDEDVYLQARTPYTIVLYPTNPSLINGLGTFPDYFDPQYRGNVVSRIREEAGKSLGDPWLLGYFVHNELPWTRSSSENIDVGLAALAAPPTQHAKVAFQQQLIVTYGGITALNAAWQTGYSSWADFLQRQDVVPDAGRAGVDLRAFDSRYAEQYFDTTRSALAEAAPQHLYLGARFTNGVRTAVAEAAASRVDVLSINRYGAGVATLPAALTADVPILVSEFHFSANDTGLLSDGLRTVADQAARAQAYAEYLQTALASDRVVGVHWLQYWDFPTSGRLNNANNNSNLGFVAITDTPYAAMVEAARGVGRVMYQTRATGLADSAIVIPAGQSVADTIVRTGTDRLVKQGEGTLVLGLANSHSGGTVVESGTLVVRNAGALGDGVLDVRAGGTAVFEVGFGSVAVTGLALTAGAAVDLGEAMLTIGPDGGDEETLRQWIVAGRNGGAWNGSEGIRSTAAGQAASSRGIGYSIRSDGSATIMFTAIGDLNLDRKVDVFDLLMIDAAGRFGGPQAAGWAEGDLNYDGRTNVFDLLAIDTAAMFNAGSIPTARSAATRAAAFGSLADPAGGRWRGDPVLTVSDAAESFLEPPHAAAANLQWLVAAGVEWEKLASTEEDDE